jgi:hypothetical protein
VAKVSARGSDPIRNIDGIWHSEIAIRDGESEELNRIEHAADTETPFGETVRIVVISNEAVAES